MKRIDLKTKEKYLIVLFIIMSIACFLSVKQGHQWGDDFAQYLEQAEALSESRTEEFVEDNTFIVLNSPIDMATPVYPWGFPLLLSVFVPLFGTNIVLYKAVCCVIIILMTICFYLFLCNYFSENKSFMLSLCVGLDYYILKFCNNVISDIPFLLIMLMIVILMNDYFVDDMKWSKLLLIGLLMGYSYMLRSQGIALLMSYFVCNVLFFVFEKDKLRSSNILAGIMPYIGFAAVYAIDKILFPHAARSSLYFLDSINVKVFLDNIWFYFKILCSFVSTPSKYQEYVYIVLLIFVFLGVIQLIKKKKDPKNILYLLFSSVLFYGINILFPWHQGGRYMIPILPLFVLLLGHGIDFVFEKWKPDAKTEKWTKICLCAAFCAYGLFFYGIKNVLNGRRYYNGSYTPEAQEVYSYINKNVDKEEVICFFKPRALYYQTGVLSIKPLDNTYEAIKGYDYVLLCDEDDYIDLDKIEHSDNPHNISLDKIFENKRLVLYRINKND